MNKRKATVLVCGVAVLDFVFQLGELPRKAEKYRARSAAIVGGGVAANGAVGIVRLGGKAKLAARLGSDVIGDLIVKGLKAEGVDCNLVRRFEGRQSSYSSVFLDEAGERQIVNYRDMNISFDAGWLEDYSLGSLGSLGAIDAVFADTRWPDGAVAAMRIARALGVPGVIDVEAALAALDIGDAWACVTDGENGVWWRGPDGTGHVPAFKVDVVDTLGAGDLWHGAFALRLGEGADEIEAVRFANAAAAIKCTRPGGRDGSPSREETMNFMKETR
ncbi:MAG: PfkB family carbohydrate kinase [Nitratireductor sp.]